jgi:drug/metabolite transporter (DMT)-like permease
MSDPALTPTRPDDAELTAAPAARWKAELALVVAAFFFGTTFVVVQDAVDRLDPLPFLALRFLMAALVLGFLARGRPASPLVRRDGIAAGTALALGYGLQTIGLQYTTPATSAFVTYLLVVFVPIIALVVFRRRPHPVTLAGIVLALVGLVLLTGADGEGAGIGLGRGELLTLGCAVMFAAHLVILSEISSRHDPVRLTVVQLATVGLGCLAAMLISQAAVALGDDGATGVGTLDGSVLLAAAFTGVFATALAFLLMVWGQRTVSATRAALIFLLEPVFAAALSWVLGDPLTAAAAAGGTLILGGVVLAELGPGLRRARPRDSHGE